MKRLFAVSLALAAAFGPPAVAAGPPQAADAYFQRSARQFAEREATPAPPRRARNVILFIGDGMGVSTVTAARIQEGQQRGVDGESNALSFEAFPRLALAKTYADDNLVTDSAAGATGLMSGVKTRNGVIGLDARARFEDCASAKAARVDSLAEIAKRAGLAAGVVTTARVTDATPAGMFGHTPARDWEDDSKLSAEAVHDGCTDLARQLVEAPGDIRLDVAMGGGLARFRPEAPGGRRQDGRDLAAEWLAQGGTRAKLATSSGELANLDLKATDRLLGLFAPEHMPYLLTAQAQGWDRPSLSAMTLAAIEVLQHNPRGYVLMVEGGLIDKASHLDNAARTLSETIEFSEAIKAALAKVDLSDTLVIVTADHSHGLVISGGADRKAPILGLAQFDGQTLLADDGKPYTTLSFATGPGAEAGPRSAPTAAQAADIDFRQPALVPMASAEHAGEDVAVYATGAGSAPLGGVIEQPYVFQVMLHALGLAGN